MPEASVDEHSDSPTSEHDVSPSVERGDRPAVNAVPKTGSVKRASEAELRLGPAAAYLLHALAHLLGGGERPSCILEVSGVGHHAKDRTPSDQP